ncbi:MAG TPA: branched-chain amino acid ABC transporter permease [Gaiellaceae bacterium]|nr:branched-chain amino acid ABC transporter permease [Gaiellaceae bacterium]
MRPVSRLSELVFPALLVAAVALLGSFTARANEIHFRTALVDVAIVVGLYVFIGNSGVLSFGQISFVAVGAFAAGLMTISADVKRGIMPSLFPILRDHSLGNVESLLLASGLGALFALVVGLPLMRLSGLAAGIATFAVLGITHNILFNYTKIGPGATALTNIPETTDLIQGMAGALIAIVAAWLYQLSRFGRMLRATREDPAAAQAVGVSIHRQRLLAFTLSGALCGFAGGLFVHQAGTITTEDVYLNLTFLTLAMLVVGGVGSLLGAVVGALLISGLNSLLTTAEGGVHILGVKVDLHDGTHLVVLGVVMALVLVVRPGGLTGGREFRLPQIWGRRPPAEART